MTLRQIRLLLWTTAATAAGLAGLSILSPAIFPAPRQIPAPIHDTGSRDLASDTTESPIIAAEFMQLAQVPLRRSLHDVEAPAAAPPPELNIHVTGTIVEPGHCRAMIELPDGSTQLKGVGDIAGDARILAIEDGQVTVQYLGKSVLLKITKENGS